MDKKQLYESIMAEVSKQVKKALNETENKIPQLTVDKSNYTIKANNEHAIHELFNEDVIEWPYELFDENEDCNDASKLINKWIPITCYDALISDQKFFNMGIQYINEDKMPIEVPKDLLIKIIEYCENVLDYADFNNIKANYGDFYNKIKKLTNE